MTKVLWFSRHEMSAEQSADLKRIFGLVEVHQVNRTISSAHELAEEIAAADVVAIVAPLPLQQQFLQIAGPDKPVLFCKNDRVMDPVDGTKLLGFRHAGWFRIKEIRVIFEKL
ncbi:MAG TPA: hypothetical protein P5262_00070 [Candidatus Moranbacteria bacterium]|nr:hypothetical protein [Candidatus Moranbacteria bacterium]